MLFIVHSELIEIEQQLLVLIFNKLKCILFNSKTNIHRNINRKHSIQKTNILISVETFNNGMHSITEYNFF